MIPTADDPTGNAPREVPRSEELESMVLASMLNDPTVATSCGLESDDFWKPSHRNIFEAISTLTAESKPVDMATVEATLDAQGRLEDAEKTALRGKIAERASSPVSVEHHVAMLQQLTQDRALLVSCANMQSAIYNREDRDDAISDLRRSMEPRSVDASTPLDMHRRWMEWYASDREQYLKTGMGDYDFRLGGILDGGLTVLGARPSVGKTAFALQAALGLARDGIPVAYHSTESGERELRTRLILQHMVREVGKEDSCTLPDLQRKALGTSDVNTWSEDLAYLPLYLMDGVTSLPRLIQRVRATVYGRGIRLVILDHIGRVRVPGVRGDGAERVMIGTALKELYRVSKDCGIAVLVLAHLNRQAEGLEAPGLAHLRMSGDLENDADEVVLVGKKERKDPETTFQRQKARDGETGNPFKLHFSGEKMTFFDREWKHDNG